VSHAVLNLDTHDCRHAVYVGRPSPLGNPYAIGPDGDRLEVIERYRKWLAARIAERDPVVCTALLGIRPGQDLACHCAPAPCHASVIAEALEQGVQADLRARAGKSLRYAGIGSRSTPETVLRTMQKLATRLSELGYTLLSGAATGADSAFEAGCTGTKEIYLPWAGFSGRSGTDYVDLPSTEGRRVAEILHPGWKRLREPSQALMARNSHQVLGRDLRSPVDFVICWTPDGCTTEGGRSRETGGTGQAIALADRWGVPVLNLARGRGEMERLAGMVTQSGISALPIGSLPG